MQTEKLRKQLELLKLALEVVLLSSKVTWLFIGIIALLLLNGA